MDSHPESNRTTSDPVKNVDSVSAAPTSAPSGADTMTHSVPKPTNATVDVIPTSVDLGAAETGIGIEFVPSGSSGKGTRPTWTAKLFALKNNKVKQNIHGVFGGDHSYDYKEKYPEDEWGTEMQAESRFYKTYLDEKDVFDNARITAWRDALDVLLVVIGLFSAIVTSFLIQTSQTLQGPDYGQITAVMVYNLILVQESLANGSLPLPNIQNPVDTPASPSAANVWVNGLWFTSLSISLSAALLAVLTKQWLYQYMAPTSGTAQERARLQQFRLSGLEKYHVPMIIDLLPITLHVSIALFLVGLALFLSTIHTGMAIAISIVTGIAYTAYIGSIVISLMDPQCPYQSPISIYLYHPWIFAADASGNLLHIIHPCVSIISNQFGNLKNTILNKLKWISVTTSNRFFWILKTWKWLKAWLNSWQQQTHTLSFQEQQNQAVLQNQQQLDIDAIAWLFSTSSNITVQDISFQAVVGLMPSNAETRKLIDVIQPYFEYHLHSVCGKWNNHDYYDVNPSQWEQYWYIMQMACLHGYQIPGKFVLVPNPKLLHSWQPKQKDGHQVFNQIIIPAFYAAMSSLNNFHLSAFLSPGLFSEVHLPLSVWKLCITTCAKYFELDILMATRLLDLESVPDPNSHGESPATLVAALSGNFHLHNLILSIITQHLTSQGIQVSPSAESLKSPQFIISLFYWAIFKWEALNSAKSNNESNEDREHQRVALSFFVARTSLFLRGQNIYHELRPSDELLLVEICSYILAPGLNKFDGLTKDTCLKAIWILNQLANLSNGLVYTHYGLICSLFDCLDHALANPSHFTEHPVEESLPDALSILIPLMIERSSDPGIFFNMLQEHDLLPLSFAMPGGKGYHSRFWKTWMSNIAVFNLNSQKVDTTMEWAVKWIQYLDCPERLYFMFKKQFALGRISVEKATLLNLNGKSIHWTTCFPWLIALLEDKQYITLCQKEIASPQLKLHKLLTHMQKPETLPSVDLSMYSIPELEAQQNDNRMPSLNSYSFAQEPAADLEPPSIHDFLPGQNESSSPVTIESGVGQGK